MRGPTAGRTAATPAWGVGTRQPKVAAVAAGNRDVPGREGWGWGTKGWSPGVQAQGSRSGPGCGVTLLASWYPQPPASQVLAAVPPTPKALPSPQPGPSPGSGELKCHFSFLPTGPGYPFYLELPKPKEAPDYTQPRGCHPCPGPTRDSSQRSHSGGRLHLDSPSECPPWAGTDPGPVNVFVHLVRKAISCNHIFTLKIGGRGPELKTLGQSHPFRK